MKKSFSSIFFPIIIILGINYAFFYPVFEGKIIHQDDIIHSMGVSKKTSDHMEKGEVLIWTDALFAGMPAMQVGMRFPKNLITQFHLSYVYLLGKPSGIYIIALLMVGFFLSLLSMRVNPWIALAGAIAFGFSTFFIVSFGAGHNAKVRTAAYIAPMLAGILLAYRGKKWLGWSIVALAMGLSVHSNHIQITYYMALTVGILVLTELGFAIYEKKIKNWLGISLGLLAAALIGIGPNVSMLWSNYDYSKETMRGGISELSSKKETSSGGLEYDYAMSWSYAPFETFNLLFTDFTGGGTNQNYEDTETYKNYFPTIKNSFQQRGMSAKQAESQANRTIASLFYWGEQAMVGGGYYIGAVIFFLFVMAFFVIDVKDRVWVGVATAFALLIGWGKHLDGFSHFMFEHFPLYSKFRVPSMAFVSIYIIAPMTGFLALQKLINQTAEERKNLKKTVIQTLYITGGLSLFFLIFGSALFSFSGPNDEALIKQGFQVDTLIEDRQALLRSSALKTLMFCLLTFASLYLYLNGKLKLKWLAPILLILIMVDQLPFVRQHLKIEDFVEKSEIDNLFRASQADEIIKRDPEPQFRVYNTTRGLTSDAYTSYHHRSLGGYHGAKLGRYQDLIDYQLNKRNQPAFNMLNTKYYIVQDERSNSLQARTNPYACGPAWLVGNLSVVEDADAEMEALTDFEACEEAVVDQRFESYLPTNVVKDTTSSIELKKYHPMRIAYKASIAQGEHFAVFSEIYYEGGGNDWKCYLNGEEVDHIRVNYLLRGLKLPAGEHEIGFSFEPRSYIQGEKYALALSFLFYGFIVFGIFKHVKDRKSA